MGGGPGSPELEPVLSLVLCPFMGSGEGSEAHSRGGSSVRGVWPHLALRSHLASRSEVTAPRTRKSPRLLSQVQEEPEGSLHRAPHQLHQSPVERLQTADQVRGHADPRSRAHTSTPHARTPRCSVALRGPPPLWSPSVLWTSLGLKEEIPGMSRARGDGGGALCHPLDTQSPEPRRCEQTRAGSGGPGRIATLGDAR